jgi:hypothetical protein
MKRFAFATFVLVALPLVARSQGDAPAPAPPTSLDELRKEYERIREALFVSRARAAAVGQALYNAKLSIFLKYGTPRFQAVSRATIRLDGAPVFDDTAGTIGTNDTVRFDGFVAPGKHKVTIRIDAEAKDDASYDSSVENTFTIEVPPRRQLVLRAEAKDDGDMGYAFPKKQRGSYKLILDVDVDSSELPNASKK